MNVKQSEILHYLGYKGQPVDENTAQLIRIGLAEIHELARNRYAYGLFDLTRGDGSLMLANSTLSLPGRDIEKHLQYSSRCAVMAVTLGLEVDQRLAYYAKTDLTRGVVLDACTSAAVEALCDQVEEEIRDRVLQQGLYLTSRYSPGYGDFPLALQSTTTTVLDAYRKIGLTITENSLLIPRKSVTAVIGLQEKPCSQPCTYMNCEICHRLDCEYRRDGGNHGQKN